MSKPVVSVVIPTYNRLPFLQEAVASIQAQTLADWELIVVDDASSDGTWAWLQTLSHTQIRIFRQTKNSERSAARNRGLEEAQGQFILFLDDDDRLRCTALEHLTYAIRHDPQLVAAVGARWKFKDNAYALRIEHPRIACQRIIWPELLSGWSVVPSQSLYRTDLVRAVGGWRSDINPVEDRDLWLKIAKLGRVAIIPDIVVEYRAHSGQWRPEDIIQRREQIFQNFISALPVEDQLKGKRIRDGARWSAQAEQNYRQGNYGIAFQNYLNTCRLVPELLISPLTGLALMRGMAKSLLRFFKVTVRR